MYHALLTNRYLTSRVIPLIAVAAVALCVALVIIVVSVMTGFLDMVKNSGRKLMGDVVVSYQVNGIPYYERLIEHIKKLPEAAAATPVVDGIGVLRMPYPEGSGKHHVGVQFWGIEPISFSEVTGYENTLQWRELTAEQWNWLFLDAVAAAWEELLPTCSESQRVQLAQYALAEDPDHLPSAEAVQERIRTFDDEYWRAVFAALAHEPDVMRRILDDAQWQAVLSHDPRLSNSDLILQQGLTLKRGSQGEGEEIDNNTIVMGMHVSQFNRRQSDGTYRPRGEFGKWWMPRHEVTLMAPSLGEAGMGGADTAQSRLLKVVNELVSGVFLIDERRVMLPLEIAQQMMRFNSGQLREDPDDPFRVTGIAPARATMVLVRAKPNVTPEQLRDAVVRAYSQFWEEVSKDPTTTKSPPHGMYVQILTWLQQQASFIGPVEKEREMMRILFSIIYLVCAGLILAIFWAIVHEKTRDIGILRSIGASRAGILWIFLRYGLIVGVIGSIAGLGLATAVVRNINDIHAAIGEDAPWWLWSSLFAAALSIAVILLWRIRSRHILFVVLCTLVLVTMLILVIGLIFHRGTLVWDPSVYYFSEIPNQVDMATSITTMIGAVVFSLLGAFIPAAKAADIEPVHALRYE